MSSRESSLSIHITFESVCITQNVDNNLSNSKNYTMYQMGGISYIIVAFAILFSIIAFFIWPFKPGNVPIEDIFLLLQNDRLGGLISLDLSMLIIIPINVIPMVVLYYPDSTSDIFCQHFHPRRVMVMAELN